MKNLSKAAFLLLLLSSSATLMAQALQNADPSIVEKLDRLKRERAAQINQRSGQDEVHTLSLPEQDCINAIPITYSVYYQPNSYSGEGAITGEIMYSCLGTGERNDVWYTFTPSVSGTLGFEIQPNDSTNDYDWAVFDITGLTCADIATTPGLEISCNFSAMWGITGPNGDSISQACNPLMNVIAGRTYVINVSNYSGTQSGYTMSFINWQNIFTPVVIAGNVYNDPDSNCIQGPGELGMRNRLLQIWPGPTNMTTDSSGHYEIAADTGTYTIHLVPKNYHIQLCPVVPPDHIVTLSGPGDSSMTNNFADHIIPNINDLEVTVTGGFFRPGFITPLVVTYRNNGTVTMNGSVEFQYDPVLSLVSASPAVSLSTASSLQWNYTNLQPDEVRNINMYMHTDSTIVLGTPLSFYALVGPEGQDTTPSDNRDSLDVIVIGAFDPNCKIAEPAGETPSGFILPGQELTYTIHFQNTGTDTAFKIVVRDQLESDLDITTFKMLSASHPYIYMISGTGQLQCIFNNILLPDSNTNEPASHGFLKFSIKPKANLPEFTQITNTGYIYFDYNAPVITDTTLNTICSTLGITIAQGTGHMYVTVYPNPAHEEVFIKTGHGSEASQVILFDVVGKEVKRVTLDSSQPKFSISGLEKGIYMYRILMREGGVAAGKLIIQ